MKTKPCKTIFLLLCLVVFLSTFSHAELVTIAIEGVVDSIDDPTNIFAGSITQGSTITGYYSYESTTVDSHPSDNYGLYNFESCPSKIFLTIEGFNFLTDSSNLDFTIGISNGYTTTDSYSLRSWYNLPLPDNNPVSDIYWQLEDSTATALGSIELPLTAPVLSAWNYNQLYIETDRLFSIDAYVTSAEVVPEPIAILFMSLGTVFLRRRIH